MEIIDATCTTSQKKFKGRRTCTLILQITRSILHIVFLLIVGQVQAQADSTQVDTLPTVMIKAFQLDKSLDETPAAVHVIGNRDMQRFNPGSAVMAMRSAPGVMMEERSPGSYRINIRGSALRAPFGVRNVKVYFNGIPITDPGGQTYLNQLGYHHWGSVEVIKGPAGSMYGAGTGGALLIEDAAKMEASGVQAGYTTGSFGMHLAHASIKFHAPATRHRLLVQRQQAGGYRQHSRMHRSALSWTANTTTGERDALHTTIFLGDLFYQTPGALTLSQYRANPRAARPPAGSFPGAQEAGASIRQQQFIAGATWLRRFNQQWRQETTAYGMFTALDNPAIQNYGSNREPHVGMRTVWKFSSAARSVTWKLNFGSEWQRGLSTINSYKNAGGVADSLRSYDEVKNTQAMFFTQLEGGWQNWLLLAGASMNTRQTSFHRFFPSVSLPRQKTSLSEFLPRLSLMRRMGSINLYAGITRGFSPPTTAELFPSGNPVNIDLQPESGLNYDIGIKGKWKTLLFDVNAFYFSLSNTIVQRRNAGGGDLYINAGGTRQTGIESNLKLPLASGGLQGGSLIWLSHTWHHFRYRDFIQQGNNFSGKALPGMAPHSIAAGIDASLVPRLAISVHYFYQDAFPLNDANTQYTEPYHLAGVKAQWNITSKKHAWLLQAGADNLLDQRYTLGADINGFGNRYYNPAAGRSWYVGLQWEWPWN